jgi:archaetidylinositol phosphate synthase
MNVWRDRLHRWFAPLARRTPLSPNAVTVIALLINLAAAAALVRAAQRPVLFLVAIALLTVGGLADAFDGIIARVKGLESRFGDFLDHCADRLSDICLVSGWCIGSGVDPLVTIAAIVAVAMNGYTGTQLEATWHEREYQTIGRGEFVLALVVYPLVSFILADNGWSGITIGPFTIPDLLALLMIVFAAAGIVQRVRLAASLEKPKT